MKRSLSCLLLLAMLLSLLTFSAPSEVFAAGNEVPAQALLELGKAVRGENALKRSRGLIGRRATSYKVKQFLSGGLCVHIGNILSY